jgi:hypothetical protein
MIDNGAVSNFSSIIIATFGFSEKRTTIIQMPSGAVSIIATIHTQEQASTKDTGYRNDGNHVGAVSNGADEVGTSSSSLSWL